MPSGTSPLLEPRAQGGGEKRQAGRPAFGEKFFDRVKGPNRNSIYAETAR
jgi:hypothetical protein